MSAPPTERLRGIKTLPQLLAYLREELDWPIDSNDTENVTFDYEASELGLDAKSAVRIKEIKQLRPLSGNQPWGIFFVNFEKKALPVMVMRRILRSLVFKKRTTAGKSERQAWNASDLLFVSSYGEEDDRAITFAHFVEDEEFGGLVELRVLGWDDDDTPLKYDYVAHTLHEKLRWRDEFQREPNEWRKTWRDAFALRHREVITTSKQLASKLANLAKKIRARVRSVLRYEDGFGQIRKLQAAFRKALIHDLSDDDFADMYAQTITYGLFSAAVSRPAGIHGENIVDMVPVTNPFLRDMLQTFLNLSGRKGRIDFDELGIQEVVALLNSPSTHLDAVLRDFGNRTQREDPVIHFYEDFLREYDARKKIQRGVFYTPQPVVSYIVRSVHELLQTEFGLEDGLADTTTWREMAKKHASLKIPEGVKPEQPFVQILDPATGTATFLVEVIDVIHGHLEAKWNKGALKAMPTLPATLFPRLASAFAEYWNQYVALALLPRVHGYELMMAPYAIAHMKVGLKLHETGYRFGSDERARIYLTNALEPPQDFSDHLIFDAPALAHEAKAVNAIKRDQRFTVVVGNPPYSGHSVNNQLAWIVDRVHDYKRGLPDLQKPGQAKWLQDDYVKFLRLAEVIVQRSARGVVGMITNHSFLDNPTFRGLRRSFMQSFTGLRFLDLHGNSKGREKREGMSEDDNVFDIQQGVGISLLTADSSTSGANYGELWGSRDSKYTALQKATVGSTVFEKLIPVPAYYLFIRQNADLRAEYEHGISIHKAMGENGDPAPGIVTTQDEFAIAFTKAEMGEHIRALVETKNEEEARDLFRLCTQSQWNYANAKRELKKGDWVEDVEAILYRPFDKRWTTYNPHVAVHRRLRVMRHLRGWKNLALITTRSVEIGRGFEHVFCTRGLIQHHTVSLKEVNFVLPLYLRPESSDLEFSKNERFNLSPAFLSLLSNRLGIPQRDKNGLPSGLTPEDIFHYAYAVFHSPGYRSRYAEFLKIDFPRLPLVGNLELFRALAGLGGELVALHLLESPKLDKPRTEFIGGRNPEVDKISWSKNTVWIDKAQTTGFKGVPEAVWNFHIGGYQVCEKWLKDRKGRTLSKDHTAHYHKIIIALAETIRLMAEIDKLIEKHGGWPAAFEAKSTKFVTMVQFPTLPKVDRIPLKDGRNYWLEFVVSCFQLVPDDLTLPLLWEAHLIALEALKYKTEFASAIGADTDQWIESLKTDAVRTGIFREVLETLAGNGNIKRIKENGRVHLVAGVTIPVIPGDWRLYDAATILATLNARPDVVDLEQFRTSSETGYTELESILA